MTIQECIDTIAEQTQQTTYGESPRELYEPIEYLMSLGGKRLRPAFTLISAYLFTDDWKAHVRPALAVEVFHNFTLMHDDIMDAAPLRRGKPTVHEKWNANTAILSGDVMLVAAYELLTDVNDTCFKQVIKRFNRTAAEVCEGQQLDMNFAFLDTVSEEQYIEMIRLKTSVLVGFAMELGGLVACAPTEVIDQLYEIGVNIGLGFQLKDDVLDVYGDPEKFGKQVGGDIIENKKTWLMLRAQQLAKGTLEEEILSYWLTQTAPAKSEQKVEAVTQLFTRLGIKELALTKVAAYFDHAFELIEKLPVEENRKKPLKDLAHLLLNRES